MSIKRILGGKSKNLFDISKVVQSARLKNNGNGTLTVSAYGVSAGILKDLCPNLKVGDTIKAYYTPISWTAQKPPSIMVISGHIMNRSFNPSFVVTDADLNGKVHFYNNDYKERDLPGTTVIGNIFITNDTSVTAANYKDRYVPHELTSYKSIMKVNDVCQLVDKSKFTASGTKNGITWVSNGDGSITLNGTCTEGFAFNPFNQQIPVDQTHFYYVSPYLSINYNGRKDGTTETGHIAYIKTSQQPTKFSTVFYIWIDKGKLFSNVTTFINIDDLTEMFGAGNEPKTVAEFKAKFPNDYYPYSPSCFVTSFDERMPCKTKNLFNYKNSDSAAKTITSHGVTLSLKNDYFELYGTQQEDKYFECSLTQFNIPFTAGKTYILSLDNAIPRLAVVYFSGFYNDDTTKQFNILRVQGTNNNPLQTFTPTKNGYFSQIVVYSSKNYRFSGNYNMRVQIEENSHKSEYVPHNYV